MVGESGLRERVEAYASLVRVPNLFSAPPDVLLGAALVTTTGTVVSIPALAGLALASVLLYAGGVVLNDYFDAPIDATERPERSIPSGRVSRRSAGVLGGIQSVSGVVFAFVVAGPPAGALATGIAVVVVLYNGVLKGSIAGFLAMGSARGLNVLLGMTAAEVFTVPLWMLAVPAISTIYIALVTRMAANEATGTGQGAIAITVIGITVAAFAVLAVVVTIHPPLVRSTFAAALAIGFFMWTGRALGLAYANPSPETVGPAVGVCVLGLVVLDAAFATVAGVGWALAVLAFLGPAVGLARLFDVS